MNSHQTLGINVGVAQRILSTKNANALRQRRTTPNTSIDAPHQKRDAQRGIANCGPGSASAQMSGRACSSLNMGDVRSAAERRLDAYR